MVKSAIKEIFIILLLSIAILLILGILFYDYIPINRVIPQKEAYVTPENVKKEVEETITETEKVEVTYEVTDSDLNIYKQSGSYTEGKANPFALNENTENTSSSSSNNSNNGTTNSSDEKDDNNNTQKNEENNTTNTENNQNTTNTFWNDEGIK